MEKDGPSVLGSATAAPHERQFPVDLNVVDFGG
jgi:hypothetical protein